jgi:hypothetical protein
VDFSDVGEVGAGGEDAAEEKRGVDGGEFYVLGACAGVDVVEVVEEAVDVRQGVGVEAEGAADLFEDLSGRNR